MLAANKRLYNSDVFRLRYLSSNIMLKLTADAATKPNLTILKLVNKITRALQPVDATGGYESDFTV
ncbi:hypothetical protein GN958_ATG17375 [Phytophthora infestans]|uniref:Uncharacterized protein n=1 Tax=Phytophthora infestans TaxID=4787 RepID=A0A8S9TXP2_PHYIN|nr:hypothetical protein GN958_ATG17375 [Phytophthora infestans]